MRKKNNNGSALITALFIMAMIASVASIMALQQLMSTKSTEQLFNLDKATLYAGGVTAWAKGVLFRNAQKSAEELVWDNLPEILPPTQYQQAILAGELRDMQALFNLNNLMNKEYAPNMVRLILAVDPSFKEEKAQDIALATHDWVKGKDEASENIANEEKEKPDYDLIYAARNPPYLSPHQPMASPSELRMVDGVTPELYLKLQPYITALPTETKINVNTAPAEVIMSLADISHSNAQSLVDDRHYQTFLVMEDFLRHPTIGDHQINIEHVTLNSEFFLVNSLVTLAKHTYSLYSLLQRKLNQNEQEKTVDVKILWESIGTW